MSDKDAVADGGDTGLSLDRYARISAHVVHFRRAPEAEVLRRLRVHRSDWDRARGHWSGLIGEELEAQETSLALIMSEPFLQERERLRRESPELSAIGPDEEAMVAVLVPVVIAALSPGPIILAKPLPSDLPPAPAGRAAPPEIPSFLRASVISSAIAQTTPPSVASPVARAPSKAATAAFAAPGAIATPFSGRASDTEAVENAKKNAEAQPRKEAASAPVAIGETAMADDLAAVMKRVMPFGPGGKGPHEAAPAPRPAAVAATPVPAPAPAQRSAAAVATPAAAARAIGDWTLEQYASLSVELSVAVGSPGATSGSGDILRRYGLSANEKDELDARWHARFQSQPALAASFERARQAYRAWLSSSRGPQK